MVFIVESPSPKVLRTSPTSNGDVDPDVSWIGVPKKEGIPGGSNYPAGGDHPELKNSMDYPYGCV